MRDTYRRDNEDDAGIRHRWSPVRCHNGGRKVDGGAEGKRRERERDKKHNKKLCVKLLKYHCCKVIHEWYKKRCQPIFSYWKNTFIAQNKIY